MVVKARWLPEAGCRGRMSRQKPAAFPGRYPAVRIRRPVGQLPRDRCGSYLGGAAGREFDAPEANQRPRNHGDGRILDWPQIRLWNLGAFPRAGIADRECHIEAVGDATDRDAGVFEASVGEPIPEGKQRLNVLLIVPAVAHRDAFRINHRGRGRDRSSSGRLRRRRETFRMPDARAGASSKSHWEGHGQPAAGL